MNCDPIARLYRWLEYAAFGRALESRRFAFLDEVADARRVLVLGEGDGRFLVKLVEKLRENVAKTLRNLAKSAQSGFSIDYIDISQRMLDLARSRAGTERVAYQQGNAVKLVFPRREYDLVVTHFFLDCLTESDAAALIAHVAASLQPNARWLISEFREPSWWARSIVKVLYAFFRITTRLRVRRLIDYRSLLSSNGFTMLREETGLFGLLASELWRFGDNGSK